MNKEKLKRKVAELEEKRIVYFKHNNRFYHAILHYEGEGYIIEWFDTKSARKCSNDVDVKENELVFGSAYEVLKGVMSL
jgi:hypothetical protein